VLGRIGGMLTVRAAVVAAGFVALAAVPACNSSRADDDRRDASVPSVATEAESPERSARIFHCPAAVTGGRARPCTLVFRDALLMRCGDKGPGGFDLMASRVSCERARRLRVSLGARSFSSWGRPGEAIYRPWLATGTVSNAEPVRAIGWTCWKRWDPTSKIEAGIRNVCWSDDGAIVLFTQA
jgi:hypothetical protein